MYVLAGVFLAVTVELCGVKSLSFAVGAYLPLATTLPIFAGGMIKGLVEWRAERKKEKTEDNELGKGSLFATGLVAGGAILGVIIAILQAWDKTAPFMPGLSLEHSISGIVGDGIYQLLGCLFFLIMGITLYRIAIKKTA